MSVITVVGGQYGSEGKGRVAQAISPYVDVAVRTGGSNAGHTIRHEGREWKMRMIPVAWTNPKTQLVLGPGAIIDEPVLRHEIAMLEEFGYHVRERLWIDERATIVDPGDMEWEKAGLTSRIGSTGKGVGGARGRRIARDPDNWHFPVEVLGDLNVADTVRMFSGVSRMENRWILLEGTQGFGLSITYGSWPYVTSGDCTPMQLMNDAGIGTSDHLASILVFRSHPIRVAGNSGPLHDETTWADISRRLGREVEEYTTVTRKVRRVGTWDWKLAQQAVAVCRPTMLALTFADYIDPTAEGITEYDALPVSVLAFIDDMEQRLGVPVTIIGTGGPDLSLIMR